MPNQQREVKLKQWLNRTIGDLIQSVGNLESYTEALEARLGDSHSDPEASLRTRIRSSVTSALDRKVFWTLEALKTGSSLVSLGQEFPLIESDLPGRNPSADILALQTETAAYVIVEIKISANAARQAITELSAYGNGLGQRYLGLNSFDALWLIVSTDFRPTLLESIAYQQLVSDRCIVPIKADIEWDDDEIRDVHLSIVESCQLPPACSTDALFSNEVFDGISINFAVNPISPDVALHFIANACARFGATGFCFQVVSEYPDGSCPYPFGIYIGTLNPFKLFRMSAFLNELASDPNWARGTSNYEQAIFEGVYDSFDVDLTTFEAKWATEETEDNEDSNINFAGIPFDHSLFELSIRDTNSHNLMFSSIFDQLLKMHGDETTAEIGGTDFPSMFFPHSGMPTYHEGNIAKVRYFGFLHDVVSELIAAVSGEDGDFSGLGFGEIYESPKLLLQLLSMGRTDCSNS